MRFRAGRPNRRGGPFRRGPGPRGPMAALLIGQLEQAHRLLEAGQPAEAAPLFANLAQQAEAHAMPVRAANLHLQAARCGFQLRDTTNALRYARAGLQAFLTVGMRPRAAHALAQLQMGLRANGLTAEAEILQREFGAPVGQAPPAFANAPAADEPPGRLPAKCPTCNGPIRSDEVEWIDDASAECPFCGSPVGTEIGG